MARLHLGRAVLAAAIVLAVAAPRADAGVTMSVAGDTLEVTDDPGRWSRMDITPSADPSDGSPQYHGSASHNLGPGSGITDMRAGPGCRDGGMGTVRCPAAPVRRIRVTAGDGQDFVFVRTVGQAVATLSPVELDLAVPLELDLGDGPDLGSATHGTAPVTMLGGEGDDQFSTSGSGDTRIRAGSGDDRYGWQPPPSAADTAAPIASNVAFEGGAGDDDAAFGNVAGRVVADGGAGKDSLSAYGTSGATRLAGGAGADSLASEANTGTDELAGGDGDDTFWVSRRDIDSPIVRGGLTTAAGGAGRDAFRVGSDGDRDVIDCGPGIDRFFYFTLEMTRPPKENEYRACPAFGVRLHSRADLSMDGTRRTVTITLDAPRRGIADLDLVRPPSERFGLAQDIATLRTRVRAGSNRLRFVARGRKARLISNRVNRQPIALGVVRIPGYDAVPVIRGLTLRRGAASDPEG